MRRRLRKKLRKGEFTELGFAFTFRLNSELDVARRLDVVDDFLAAVIEPQALALYGGGGAEWAGLITSFGRGSVSESQRAVVLGWLASDFRIDEVRAGPLVDVWHSGESVLEVPAA